MRRPTSLILTLLLLAGTVAGCVGNDDTPQKSQEDPAALDVKALDGSSERSHAQITHVAGDLTYEDLVVAVNGNAYAFAAEANYHERRYSVTGVGSAQDAVATGHRLNVPAAGLVDVQVRHADTGEILAQYRTTVGDDTAPTAPTNVAPAKGAQDVPRTPVFQWEPVRDPSGTTYNLEVSLDPTFNAPLVVHRQERVAATNFALGDGEALAPGQTYYWHVQAVDGNGNAGPWSTTWSFTTAVAE